MSSIPSFTLNQLVSGFSIATAQFQQGEPARVILQGIRAFLPPPESEWVNAVEPLRTLSIANGGEESEDASELKGHVLASAFHEAARRLYEITQDSHPHVSLWADNVRRIWRRGLSSPPQAEPQALVADFQQDERLLIEWLRQFIEFSPQPMGVVKCHPDGNAEMVMFNKKNRERWGLKEANVAGVDALRFFYPDDHDMFRATIRECLESGSSTRTGIRILRRAGGHLLVDVHFGRVDATNYAYFQAIDETQREEAIREREEAIRERDEAIREVEILSAVFRHVGKPLLVLRFDDDSKPVGMVTSLAFHRMLGYAPGEIGTKPVMDFIPPYLQKTFAEKLRQFLETGTLIWQAVELMHKDGSTVLVDIEANDSGVKGKRFAIASFGDAQARIAAERDAAKAREASIIADVTKDFAHNGNNMLTVISGGLQLLSVRYPDDDFLNAMIQNADMLNGILNSFRRITDTIEGEMDVHSILNKDMVRLVFRKTSGAEIIFDLAENPWTVAGPNFAVWQIINNLIKNALEAMENAPVKKLTIGTENVQLLHEGALRRLDPENRFHDARPGDYLKISIEDTGSGIPPEILSRFFDEHISTKEDSEVSRGRGVVFSRRAIANRGGILTVRSAVGQGSVFEIYLPSAQSQAPANQPAGAIQAGASTPYASFVDTRLMSRGDEIVLIADDDAAIRDQYATVLLKYFGYKEVLFATTTQETLKVVKDRPDLTAAVVDWRMPGDTGDILLGDLRSLRPKLPILVNTGQIPDHQYPFSDIRFTTKLKGMSNIAAAVRRLIDGDHKDT